MNSHAILSDITVFSKYARFKPEALRRETWVELVQRNCEMHQRRYPSLALDIEELYEYVYDKKVLPSMRSAQFAGRPIEINPSRQYNCAFMNVDNPAAFWEAMFLLLGGTGVGFSVQRRHVRALPPVIGPKERKRRHVIGDSIEGWADSVKVLVRAYLEGRSDPDFDFSDIRPKGARLVTSGGKAPGPQPLKDCLHNLRKVLDSRKGDSLRPIDAHDMMCYIADAVLAGGIRRAALISLFSMDDKDMLHAKHGNWWELNAQRGRANNSAVVYRNRVREADFFRLWNTIELSGSGEPGIYLTNNPDWGTNPCCEIALRDMQFCNLTEINASDVESQQDLNERAAAAAALGTLQASYTNFHYLRPEWQDNCEAEALLGVSMTGIASGACKELDLHEASEIVREVNRDWAERLGINPAARLTCVKPAGTTSLVLGTSSGIHDWHDQYYLRRMRFGKTEAIAKYLMEALPECVEEDKFNASQVCVAIPVKAPEGASLRGGRALDLLERVRRWSEEWVKPGHNSGDNTHNVSATITVKPNEWADVGQWMWENRHVYNGLSVLPYDGGTYIQAPFESIDKATYDVLSSKLGAIDLTQIVESADETDLTGEIACAGGKCEI